MINYQEDLERYQEEIEQLAAEKRYAELRDLFLPMEPADIALLLEEGKQELMPLLYRLLPKETAAEVFVELEPLVARHRVGGHGAVGVADMELGRGVVDRRCDIKFFLTGIAHGNFLLSAPAPNESAADFD